MRLLTEVIKQCSYNILWLGNPVCAFYTGEENHTLESLLSNHVDDNRYSRTDGNLKLRYDSIKLDGMLYIRILDTDNAYCYNIYYTRITD